MLRVSFATSHLFEICTTEETVKLNRGSDTMNAELIRIVDGIARDKNIERE